MEIESKAVLSSFNDFKIIDKQTANEWERFQKGGGVVESRSVVLSSWKRSKKYNIDPRKRLADVIYTDDSLREQKEKSEPLLKIAKPHIERMFSELANPDIAIILSDHNGIIISEISSEEMWNKVEKHHFLSGADWSEEGVGTNAIGTALVEKRPVQIFSSEHFCEGWHPWVCSSSPIRDPITNEILGVLNITGEKHVLQAHNIDLVTYHARQVEHNIGFRLMKDKLLPLHSLFNSFIEPVIIYNLDGEIKQMNRAASHLLNLSIGENVFKISELKERKEYNLFKDYIQINGVQLNDILWNVKLYSYKYGERVLGSMAIFEKRRSANVIKEQGETKYSFDDIITKNKEMLQVINRAKKAAYSNLNTVVYGETGTGKELIVQSIHGFGKRRDKPFVAINCGAIPKELIGSELFGYEAGAFTGARAKGKQGKFQQADQGTIFLDEISELPLDMQLYLLRVIEEKEVVPLGASKPIPIDVRIICATNKDLKQEVEKGNFREDLYYRLQVISLSLPPLRERCEDIPLLVNSFLSNSHKQMEIDDSALKLLKSYHWPGNIRQLRNCIEQALFNTDSNVITPNILPNEMTKNHFKEERSERKEIDKDLLVDTLEKTNGNITRTAKVLGVSRMTIYRKKDEFQLR